MRYATAFVALSLSALAAGQDGDPGREDAALEAGQAAGEAGEAPLGGPAELLQRFDANGDASLDISELEALHRSYFPQPSGPAAEAEAALRVGEFLREHAGRAPADLAKEQPAGLLNALIIDPEGMEVGRIVRLAIDREEGAYHAVIPAGKLVELVGIEFMAIPLARLRINEDVLLLDDADAVQAFQEEHYHALEESLVE